MVMTATPLHGLCFALAAALTLSGSACGHDDDGTPQLGSEEAEEELISEARAVDPRPPAEFDSLAVLAEIDAICDALDEGETVRSLMGRARDTASTAEGTLEQIFRRRLIVMAI